jgi:hypothetical protein
MASRPNGVDPPGQRVLRRATTGLLIGIPVALLLLVPAVRYAGELGPDSKAGLLLLAGVAGIPILAAMLMGLTSAAATAQATGASRLQPAGRHASESKADIPQFRRLKSAGTRTHPSTKGSRRSRDRSNTRRPPKRLPAPKEAAAAATAQIRASCRNCPHAAAMSRPRLARMWTFTCFARRTSWNACTSPEVGRANGTPSTSL